MESTSLGARRKPKKNQARIKKEAEGRALTTKERHSASKKDRSARARYKYARAVLSALHSHASFTAPARVRQILSLLPLSLLFTASNSFFLFPPRFIVILTSHFD